MSSSDDNPPPELHRPHPLLHQGIRRRHGAVLRPPDRVEPGLCLQLHHDQDLGDCEQPQHHEDQQVIGGHTREVQTEEGACSAVLPKIFRREIGFRDGESGQRQKEIGSYLEK